MSTLAEIEAAADALPPEQKQELILFLATRLRSVGAPLPEPRKFTREQIEQWIKDDEEGMRRFVASAPNIHPEVRRMSGLAPSDIDAEALFRTHMVARHQ
jgi:hypothetical protein